MNKRLPLLFSIITMIIIFMANSTYGAFTLEDERKLGMRPFDLLQMSNLYIIHIAKGKTFQNSY